MKKSLLLLTFSILIFSCSSSKKITDTSVTVDELNTPSKDISGDGSSYEKAIVIDEKTEIKGVDAEYDWLKENYPGYKMVSQKLSQLNGRFYDILKINTSSGETKEIYFDITNFFGKF